MGTIKMINVEQQLLFTLKDATAGMFFPFPVVVNQHEIPCVLHHSSPISESIHIEQTKVKRKLSVGLVV